MVRDYMREFGSVGVFAGPVVQVVRGLVIAVVLVPFRSVIAGRHGWLWLRLLLVGIGILFTSAAAPSSIEGVVYSELPLWYHAVGLPEMLGQTLLFSALMGSTPAILKGCLLFYLRRSSGSSTRSWSRVRRSPGTRWCPSCLPCSRMQMARAQPEGRRRGGRLVHARGCAEHIPLSGNNQRLLTP